MSCVRVAWCCGVMYRQRPSFFVRSNVKVYVINPTYILGEITIKQSNKKPFLCLTYTIGLKRLLVPYDDVFIVSFTKEITK